LAIASLGNGSRGSRLAAVDLARGVAIVAMVVYHTAFDLSADRLIATDVAGDLRWKVFARLIAGTFLFLVGVSLVLATRNGFNRGAFLRRLAFVAGGAFLVSIATWWFDPATFVFFGILHEIAAASVLALPFLSLPSTLVAPVAAAIIAAPWFLANPFFDAPAFWWLGLSADPPVTVDYVPILPWFGVVLAGVVGGRLLVSYGGALWNRRPADPISKFLMTAGRWSLAIYLIHQPLIVAALHVYATLVPPSEAVVREGFTAQCVAACTSDGRGSGECTSLCGCMFENLYGTDLFAMKSLAQMSPEQMERWDGIVDRCRMPIPSP
jgi:uncharacterized membrane protein